MFDEFRNISFSKVYLEFTTEGLEIDLSKLETDTTHILLSYNSSIEICKDGESEVAFLFNCTHFPNDSDDVGAFTTTDITMYMGDFELDDDEEESMSFEFTYPSKMTYNEVLYSYRFLLSNIFSVINNK